MYRAHNQNARNMLQSWFAQVQNYSIEDQISYPYVYWQSNMEYSRTVLLPKDLCRFLSPFAKAPVTDASKIAGPYGSCYEAHTVDKKLYGKA